jgi:hypothetical protein
MGRFVYCFAVLSAIYCRLWRTTTAAFVVGGNNGIAYSYKVKSNPLLTLRATATGSLKSEDIKTRLAKQLQKLREKDRNAKSLSGKVSIL